MKFKVGDRIKIEYRDFDFDSGTLVGETGTVVKIVDPRWTDLGDVVIDLDCGITGIIYDSELLIKLDDAPFI